MDYSFIIRKAVPDDAQAIQNITKEAFAKYKSDTNIEVPMEALEESLEDIKKDIETKEVFIALVDGNPVASIRVAISPDKTAYISRFGVRLQYHNMGIGKAIMSLVDELLISKGVKKAYLHTASKYKALVRFYYGRGFYVHSTTEEKGYIRALMVKEY
ncbi:MAG TPA: GNAT family N-acetyltransferase [Clostridiaceae bacterium]|nr:GNAT family N-acetyltransferase [Clostridiaceae bacterium]